VTLRKFSVLLPALMLALSQLSCVGGPVPKWDGKLFVGSDKDDAIVRNNPNEPHQMIKCSDPLINDYICMSQSDFRALIMTYVNGCAQWKKGSPMVRPDLLWYVIKPE
jgi:hypothetical protein